ncbi:MAG: response regulator transcription factor [Micrococcales bacterium]|uniref:response regulator transcription factor n=1 Tax=Phycicoccus sp. TaxID=1902410 RepID=UPI0019BC8A38|nr:response regulator transcription factor [Phycicoccus sp.]MBD3784277.1 response regulator transcription factor [Micrococcales bacterium]HMM94696.1 response regulator transcription factor [Phycicoccus sp.]
MDTAHRPRILVADDDPDIRDLVEFKLTQSGFDVHCVGDGLEAWDAFVGSPPDGIVLDVMMPGLSGIDVLLKIREHQTGHLPVLMLSARSRDADVDAGFAVGADDYLVKPFSPRELVHRVNGILARPRR